MSFERTQFPPNKKAYEEPRVEIVSTDDNDIIMNSNMVEWDTPYNINRTFNF